MPMKMSARISRKGRMLETLQGRIAKQKAQAEALQKELTEMAKKQNEKWLNDFSKGIIKSGVDLNTIPVSDVIDLLKDFHAPAENAPVETKTDAPENLENGESAKEQETPKEEAGMLEGETAQEEHTEEDNEKPDEKQGEANQDDIWQAPQAF